MLGKSPIRVLFHGIRVKALGLSHSSYIKTRIYALNNFIRFTQQKLKAVRTAFFDRPAAIILIFTHWTISSPRQLQHFRGHIIYIYSHKNSARYYPKSSRSANISSACDISCALKKPNYTRTRFTLWTISSCQLQHSRGRIFPQEFCKIAFLTSTAGKLALPVFWS